MSSEDVLDKVQQVLLILPHIAPHQAQAALERRGYDVGGALEELMRAPVPTDPPEQVLQTRLKQRMQPVYDCYVAEMNGLQALPSRTLRQFGALLRLARDEAMAFWVTDDCSALKAHLTHLLDVLASDDTLKKVRTPLLASASGALAEPNSVSVPNLTCDAQFLKASFPALVAALRQYSSLATGTMRIGWQTLERFHDVPNYATLRAFFDSLMCDLSEQEPTIQELLALLKQAWPKLRDQTGFKAWLLHMRAFGDELTAVGIPDSKVITKLINRGLELLQELKDYVAQLSEALGLQRIAAAATRIADWVQNHPDLSHVKQSSKNIMKSGWRQVEPLWQPVPRYLMGVGQSQLKDVQLKPVKMMNQNFELWDLVLVRVDVAQEDVHFLVLDDVIMLTVDSFIAHMGPFKWRASLQAVKADEGTGEVKPVRGTFRVAVPVTEVAPSPAIVELHAVDVEVHKPAGSWVPSWVYNKALPLFTEHIRKGLQEGLTDVLSKKATALSQQVAPQLRPMYPLLTKLFAFYHNPRQHAAELFNELAGVGAALPAASSSSSRSSAPTASNQVTPAGASGDGRERKAQLVGMGFAGDAVEAAMLQYPNAPVSELIDRLCASL